MNEDTKKPLNGSLATEVQETNKDFISSDFIIKSHELIEQGFKVYLLAQGTNTPYKGSNGHLDATNDVYKLIDMFNRYGVNSNIGISLVDTGVAVLDVDRHATNGFQSLIQSGHTLNLDNQIWESTPRSGAHIFFKIPDGVRADELKHNLMAGVELLTSHVTVAPSIKLVDGIEAEYKHFGGDISKCSVMPDWLVKMASNVATSGDEQTKRVPKYSVKERWQMVLNGFTEGERNLQCTSISGYLLRLGIPTKVAYEIVDLVNSRSSVPLADKEINMIFRSVYEREKRRLLGGQ